MNSKCWLVFEADLCWRWSDMGLFFLDSLLFLARNDNVFYPL